MNLDATSPWPYEARASIDGRRVAASVSALIGSLGTERPILLFPVGDLAVDVADLAEVLLDDVPVGFVGFDHDNESVRVELVDAPADDVDRESTVKRFPVWGDITDLVALIDVQPDGEARYAADLREGQGRSIVEGSQMLGQAIVAACREVPGRRVVSASMTFLRVVHDSQPYTIELDTVASGRSFSSFVAHVVQDGRRCATALLLLGTTTDDVMRHEVDAPDVAGPRESPALDMAVTGREIRVVDAAYTNDSAASVGPPVIDAWLRHRGVPDDSAIHAALLTQFTGAMSIAASMRPHEGIGQDQAHRSFSTAVMAINVSFHADPRADEWMLFRHLATHAGDGLTHSECRMHDEAGHLVASFTVDSIVRPFAASKHVDATAAI